MDLTAQLEFLADYYKRSTTRKMPHDRREYITNVLASGLAPVHVMDAIDKAACRFGLNALDRDYWETINAELRRTYLKMKKEGLLCDSVKNAPANNANTKASSDAESLAAAQNPAAAAGA